MRADDRVAHAAPVGRDRWRIEADAAVAHEHLDAVRLHLGVEVHALAARRTWPRWSSPRARPARSPRARRRAARRRRSRPRSARGAAPRPPPRRARAPPPRCPRPSRLGRLEQPVAQLALLAARQAGHLARVVGALLDQRERLQDRVVQVGGQLGALLLADARGALGGQAAREAHDPGPEQQARVIVATIATAPIALPRLCSTPTLCRTTADGERHQQRADDEARRVDPPSARRYSQRGAPRSDRRRWLRPSRTARRSGATRAPSRTRRARAATRSSRRSAGPRARSPTDSAGHRRARSARASRQAPGGARAAALSGADRDQRPGERVDGHADAPDGHEHRHEQRARAARPPRECSASARADTTEQAAIGVAAQRRAAPVAAGSARLGARLDAGWTIPSIIAAPRRTPIGDAP